jgi:hypothetical protein
LLRGKFRDFNYELLKQFLFARVCKSLFHVFEDNILRVPLYLSLIIDNETPSMVIYEREDELCAFKMYIGHLRVEKEVFEAITLKT